MKSFVFLASITIASVCAQTSPAPAAAPAPATPASSAAANSAAPKSEQVVATFGKDQKVTVADLEAFVNMLPEQMQRSAMQDRKGFVQQFALMSRLADLAEQAKLADREPTKETLKYSRMYILMNAQLRETINGFDVPATETKSYYDSNKNNLTQVKVKAIYISFGGKADAGKTPLSEADAKAKIEKIRTDLIAGADFVKMVKENSDDKTSAAKDGDFGTIRRTDKLPDAIGKAIFALKAGELSEAVRQPNGFYLFRAEEITPQPFSEVQEQIVNELKQVRFKAWMEDTIKGLNLKYETSALATNSKPTVTPVAAK